MKRNIKSALSLLAIVATTLAVAACGDKKKTSYEDEESLLELERNEENHKTIIALSPFQVCDSIRMNGHEYVYTIERTPLDSVIVVDEEGYKSQDNSLKLRILCDGAPFFEKKYSRSAFHIHIDENYYQQCILLGMNFDRITEYGLRFIVSIGKGADGEDYKPYSLTVGPDGSTNITEHDLYEDDEVSRFEDEGV